MMRISAKFFFVLADIIICPYAIANVYLNHYGDYGVLEQAEINNRGDLRIQMDPFGYSDEYTDHESGLQYLQVRYYNPTIMRFTAMDTYPLLNRYAYANENPVMDDDPSGHSPTGTSSSKLDDGSADAGTPESVFGMFLAMGFVLTGLTGNEVGIGVALVDITSGASGGFSYIVDDSKTKEILSLYSLIASTAVNVMDMGAAFYNYKQPARLFDVGEALSNTNHDFLDNNQGYYKAIFRGDADANCASTNMSMQEHLVNSSGREGGYNPIRSDSANYDKLTRIMFSNKTVSSRVTLDSFLEAVSLKSGNESGVYGIWLRQGRVGHLGTLIIENTTTSDGIYFIDPKLGKIGTLKGLLERAQGMSPENSVWVSFYRAGDFNQSSVKAFSEAQKPYLPR